MGVFATLLAAVIFLVLKGFWRLLNALPIDYIVRLLNFDFWGSEVVILLIIIFLLGSIFNYLQSRTGPFVQLFAKIPYFGKFITIPASIKNIVKNGKWILLEESPDIYVLATTSEITIEAVKKATGKDLICIGINSYPFPGTGCMIKFVSRDKIIIPENVHFDDWLPLLFSGGLLQAEIKSVKKMSENNK